MSPGKIERSDGSPFAVIKGHNIHEDRYDGKAVKITESFWDPEGVYMIDGKSKTHLVYGHTIALDSGLIVIPYKESSEEYESRQEQSNIDGKLITGALHNKNTNNG